MAGPRCAVMELAQSSISGTVRYLARQTRK
nr:TPA_asm: m87.4 sORF 2 [Murid betaherpesvirus 1]DBA08029.1 TPA_asm: m87.4 sORF 2 [Murid betaherpesvirus 1]